MKIIYNTLLASLLFFTSINAYSQNSEQKVKEVLAAYKQKIEALNTEGMSDLFLTTSEVFESGGSEGSFDHYLHHHLGPELKAFKAFNFNNYVVEVKVDGMYAFATETYDYRIELAEGGRVIEKKGVATSVLKKVDNQWKIMRTHSSSRDKK
tara:strand:- start:1627 stop:2082 length:456 start_codon:yes stop_codon:yes gene_type:complete